MKRKTFFISFLKTLGIVAACFSSVIIALLSLFTLCLFGFGILSFPIPFDSERWKVISPEQNDNTRNQMLDDLIAKHKLIGLTKDEIIELLGSPDSSDGKYVNYWLGHGYIDPVYLILEFENGKVIKYELFAT